MQYFFIKPCYHSSYDLDQAKIRDGSQIRDTDENRKVALKNRYNRYNRYTYTVPELLCIVCLFNQLRPFVTIFENINLPLSFTFSLEKPRLYLT